MVNHLHSINTGLDGDSGIVHVAANVGKDLIQRLGSGWHRSLQADSTYLSLQAKLANSLAVLSRLLGSTGAGKLNLRRWSVHALFRNLTSSPGVMTHVVNTEIIQSLGNFDLLLGVEESVGELLTLTQSTLDDLEARDVAQEVGDTNVVAIGVPRDGGVGVLASLDGSEAGVFTFEDSISMTLALRLFPKCNHTVGIGAIGLPIGLVVCTGAHCVENGGVVSR